MAEEATSDGDPAEPRQDSPIDDRPERWQLIGAVAGVAAVAFFMGGAWALGLDRDGYPLAAVFPLTVASFAITWLVVRGPRVRFGREYLAWPFAAELVVLGFVGERVLSSRFPDFTLPPPATALVLGVAATLAVEVASPEGFCDLAIMFLAGYVLPQAAFTIGLPRSIWTVGLIGLFVLVPLGAFVFRNGPDEDLMSQVVAPVAGMVFQFLLHTPEPVLEWNAVGVVALFFLIVRHFIRHNRQPAHVKGSTLLVFLILGTANIDLAEMGRLAKEILMIS